MIKKKIIDYQVSLNRQQTMHNKIFIFRKKKII